MKKNNNKKLSKENKTKVSKKKKTNSNKNDISIVKTKTVTKKTVTKKIKNPENSKFIVSAENVKKSYGHFEALKGISFKIEKGERVGIIGGNGAGKTTLAEIIAGINKPSSGTISYGFKFDKTPKEVIGMQFQQSTYPSGLSVKDIIQFAMNLRKLKLSNTELQSILKTFQMAVFYKKKVRALSGGQRQKLNILLSIIHKPELVILDELSTGLDISAREEIIRFTDKFLSEKNMSLVLISHHMAEIRALCSRVIILDNGTIAAIKTIKEIDQKHNGLEKYSIKLIEISNKKLMSISSGKNPDGTDIIKDKSKELKKQIAKDKKKEKKYSDKDKAKVRRQNEKSKRKFGNIDLSDLEQKIKTKKELEIEKQESKQERIEIAIRKNEKKEEIRKFIKNKERIEESKIEIQEQTKEFKGSLKKQRADLKAKKTRTKSKKPKKGKK